jgi:hypothetical protein
LQASLPSFNIYPAAVATTYVFSGAKGSVGIDDVFAKEMEDVIVDFGGKGVPVRHWRVVLKDVRGRWTQRVSCSSANLLNQTSVRASSRRQSHWIVGVTLGSIQWTGVSINAGTESLELFPSRCALIARRKCGKGGQKRTGFYFQERTRSATNM